ncbi:hypothetical protein [Micromonospora sp. CPCC 206061]|uniref:hypothetical protein n=1 Tax=Micromonospora sp. CPCC 206061 TaxID=3122410 RepID=UPI002FEEF54C
MNTTDHTTGTDRFEDRLLEQLRADFPRDSRPEATGASHRRRMLRRIAAPAVAAAATAVVGALIVTAANPAYAIRAEPDGSFAVVLYSTDAADLAKAEQELQRKGARIELIPATMDCLGVLNAPQLTSPPHPTPSGPPNEEDHPEFLAFWPVIGDEQQRSNPITGETLRPQERAFTVRPDLIPTGQVLWVAVAGGQTSTLAMVVQFEPVGAGQPEVCA